MPHHVLHDEASQGFFFQANAKSPCLEKEDFNESCKELKCTCESGSAELPLLALALSAGKPQWRTWSTASAFSAYRMTSVSVIQEAKFICCNRYIWSDFLSVASVLLHPKEEKALSLPSSVLISLAEVQSAPGLKFATISSVT